MLSEKLRRLMAGALCGAMLFTLPACQEDPEGSIVANKDMDKLISQGAESGGESRVDAGELIEDAKKTETYKTTLDSPNLKVKAEVDAQVELPEVEKLSIYRVKQKPFTQEFLDKVRAELCGEVELFDGAATQTRVKRDIEKEIQSLRRDMTDYEAQMQQMENDPDVSDEDKAGGKESLEVYIQETQQMIDELQQEYETAPGEIIFSDYPTDGKLLTVEGSSTWAPHSEFYDRFQSLSADGDQVFYGVSDGRDGVYHTLYVNNNADYSNHLMYSRDLDTHAHVSVLADETSFDPYMFDPEHVGINTTYEEYYRDRGVPGNVLTDGTYFDGEDMAEVVYTPVGSPTVEMTEEDAKDMAGGLLTKLGLTDFVFDEGGLYTEMDGKQYKVNYIFKYRRSIDGVTLSQSSGGKFQAGYSGEGGSYNKQMWPGESIEIRVNDRGIVGFQYNAPLEITETVVEGTSLKTFDEVKGIFEQMLPMVLAEEDYDVTARVDRVRLSYSRISEKDSFDTGLVVPVWSFEGKVTAYSGEYPAYERNGTLLAVNAIDGSVIDANLGY